MQVRIHKDIFNDSSNNDVLNDILAFFRQDRHHLILDDFDDIEAFKNSTWAQNELNSRDLKLINEFIVASTRREKEKLLISLSNENNKDFFSPREAYLYLNQPLIVLVENVEYEPPFINAIIRNFDNTGELGNAKKQIWWEFGMAAGSSAEQVINGKIENSLSNDEFVKPKENYLRYFVILDSDKKYESDIVSEGRYKFMNEKKILFHILYKREKENYMPDNILTGLESDYFNNYLNLEAGQKDFFDLEKGFNKNKSDKDWKTEIRDFFSIDEIPDSTFKILKNGSDLEIYKKGEKFKREFSKLFNYADKDNMLTRISHQPKFENGKNEYEHIVEMIKSLL